MLYTGKRIFRSVPLQTRLEGDEKRLSPPQAASIQTDIRQRLAPYLRTVQSLSGKQRIECHLPETLTERFIEPLLRLGDTILANKVSGRELGKAYVGSRFLATPTDHLGRRVHHADERSTAAPTLQTVADHIGNIAALAAWATHAMPYGPDGLLRFRPTHELILAQLTASYVEDKTKELAGLPLDIHDRMQDQATCVGTFVAQHIDQSPFASLHIPLNTGGTVY